MKERGARRRRGAWGKELGEVRGLPVVFAAVCYANDYRGLPYCLARSAANLASSHLGPLASSDVKLENEAKLGIRVSKKTSVFETFETLRTEKHGFPAARRELPEFQKSFS